MFFLKHLAKFGGGAAAKKFQDEEKPFLEHLEDLRVTLFKILITLLLSTIAAFVFNKQLIGIIQYPLSLAGIETVGDSFGPVEGFMGVLKICLYAGLLCSFPLILYFIGEFVIPGLTDKEKKLVIPVVLASFVLFGAGVCFAYFIVIPRALEFFIQFGEERNIMMDLRFRYAVSFITMMCLAFGLCFELPVVVMTLVKLDLLNSRMMRNTRSYAIVAMFIVAAIVTPTPDIFTMSLLAGPMIILYEACIWMAWWMERKRERLEAAEREREKRALIEHKKRERARREAREAEEAEALADGQRATKKAAGGTVPYSPDNEAVFDEGGSAGDDEGVERDGDSVGEAPPGADAAGVDPGYHSGLEEAGDAIDPESDEVWGYTPGVPIDSGHGDDPYHHGDHGHDDYHDPHHYDHHYHHDDYYSGPTEELKRMLREELKADLKQEIMMEIKAELKSELVAELREEFGRDRGGDNAGS